MGSTSTIPKKLVPEDARAESGTSDEASTGTGSTYWQDYIKSSGNTAATSTGQDGGGMGYPRSIKGPQGKTIDSEETQKARLDAILSAFDPGDRSRIRSELKNAEVKQADFVDQLEEVTQQLKAANVQQQRWQDYLVRQEMLKGHDKHIVTEHTTGSWKQLIESQRSAQRAI